MSLRQLQHLLKDPLGVLRTRLASWRARRRFQLPIGYRAKEYWLERHGRFGFDLRGVGDHTMTEEENLAILRVGGDLVLEFCRRHGVSFPTARVLDVGCGVGYYAGVLRSAGVKSYTGVDIVDTLFGGLRERFPDFTFRVTDIGERTVEGEYDLILLLDVAQHITDESRFTFALRSLKLALAPSGLIIISTSLGPYQKKAFYFATRPLESFTQHFPGSQVDGPVPFCGNGMFVLRRTPVE